MTTLKTRPASLSNSWEDVKKHAKPLAFALLATLALSVIDFIVYFIVSMIFTALFGGEYSDFGALFGAVFGHVASLPIYIVACMSGMLVAIIPALYFEGGEVVSFSSAVAKIRDNFMRYLLAGIFFNVMATVGFLFCILPGIAISLTLPIYVNKIFNTNLSILEAFSASFSAVFKDQGWSFVGIQIVGSIAVGFVGVCTCLFGLLIAVPMYTFYMQNLAYNKGLVS